MVNAYIITMPDHLASVAIAEESGLRVIADWIDNGNWEERSARWKDHVFVGQKM